MVWFASPATHEYSTLIGDQYFVCWDPDLVPPYDAQVLRLSTTPSLGSNFSHTTTRQTRNELVKRLLGRSWLITSRLITSASSRFAI